MIPTATHSRQILPGVWHWSVFSPHHKVELASSAIRTRSGWWIFDPIPLHSSGEIFLLGEPIAGIVLTNANHERNAQSLAARWKTTIWANPDAHLNFKVIPTSETSSLLQEDWAVVSVPGGALGETVFHLAEKALLVIGDAVVNLPERGLELLPEKYCEDQIRLRQSLLLLPECEHALFAHGTPIIGNAYKKLQALWQTPSNLDS